MQGSLAKEDVSLDEMMAEAIMLRGRRARRPRSDRGEGDDSSGAPVRPTAPHGPPSSALTRLEHRRGVPVAPGDPRILPTDPDEPGVLEDGA